MSGASAVSQVAVRVVSDPAYMCVVRAAAERFCLLAGFDAKVAHAVGLALDEALANVINHGYGGRRDQPIHVEFRIDGPDPGELCICVRDFGRQVSQAEIAPRPLDEVRPGGLGVHIMRSVMDRVEYRRRGLAGMELRMTKRRPAGPAGGGPCCPDEPASQQDEGIGQESAT